MQLVDTHSHIHDPQYKYDSRATLAAATATGVDKIICVGTTIADSHQASEFASKYDGVYATVGLHPHDATPGLSSIKKLEVLVDRPKVVAIGECGLDYYHLNSSKPDQEKIFRSQIELALANKLPVVFHVRQAFKDFFRIIDSYPDTGGVIHSFSSSVQDLDNSLSRGFYVAFNGIMTFTKNDWQLAAAKSAPLERLLLETDSPFLTPVPERGKINQPAYVKLVAEFLAALHRKPLVEIAKFTTKNAQQLFKL